jgi:hypothetical protein
MPRLSCQTGRTVGSSYQITVVLAAVLATVLDRCYVTITLGSEPCYLVLPRSGVRAARGMCQRL